jgi:DNA-binding NarL/FixJ family response regulator
VNTLKVVLVDDTTEIRHRVKTLLEDIPKVEVVGEVGDPVNALEVIDTLRPHVVILDIHMPDGSGITVLRQIKLLDPSIVVIILTNHVESHFRSVSLKSGAYFFFDKTLELQDLISAVSKLHHSRFGGNEIPDYPNEVGPTIH